MASKIDSFGEIECISESADLAPGKTARIVFRTWEEHAPPFTVKVRAPDGKLILERVIRDLPTGKPQSPPPVTFAVQVTGAYKIEIRQLYGGAEGEATLTVT